MTAPRFCGNCGAAAGPVATFCGACGQPLGVAAPPAPLSYPAAQPAPAAARREAAPDGYAAPESPTWGRVLGVSRAHVAAVLGLFLASFVAVGIVAYQVEQPDSPEVSRAAGYPRALATSPDGAFLALAASSGAVLVNSSTLATVRALPGSPEYSGRGSASFSPDGKLVAAGSGPNYQATPPGPGVVEVWQVSDGSLVRSLAVRRGDVDAVAFSPDGQLLAGFGVEIPDSGGSIIHIWRTSNWSSLRTIELADFWDIHAALAFSPDGSLLAATTKSSVTLYRLSDGAVVRTIPDVYAPTAVRFSPSGSEVAVAMDSDVAVFRTADGQLLRRYDIADPYSLAFSNDGMRLAAGGFDGVIHVWRLTDGVRTQRIQATGKEEFVWGVAFSADGTRLYAVTSTDRVQAWKLR